MGIALDLSAHTHKSQLGTSGSTVAEISSDQPEKSSGRPESIADLPTILRESIVRLAGQRSWSDNRDTWLNLGGPCCVDHSTSSQVAVLHGERQPERRRCLQRAARRQSVG